MDGERPPIPAHMQYDPWGASRGMGGRQFDAEMAQVVKGNPPPEGLPEQSEEDAP